MKHPWLRLALVLLVPITSACAPDGSVAPDPSGAPARSEAVGPPVPVGLADADGRYVVDTRAGLIFQVNKTNCDIVSLRYEDVELQDQSKFSHIASGLGSAEVVATPSADGTVVTIACTTPTLTHYYVARGGTSAIFMATYVTAEPSVGELRYIARLDKSRVPDGNPNAEIAGGVAIEGSDVFLVNGVTRSKYYSNPPAIDNLVHGVTGPGVGVYMIMGNRESSSGGPFFRDINNQGSSQQELYNYMNSNHTQTEPYRMGLHGPYALVVTSGEAPSADLDMSWMGELGLQGWVAESERGRVTGKVAGMTGGIPGMTDRGDFVVAWSNERAQYWARVSAAGGDFTSPLMIPGTYTTRLYRGELAVDSSSVTVGQGTVTEDLRYVDPPEPTIFRIGGRDGTPAGFRNADLIADMHPSDTRMQPWGPLTYTVGSSPLSDFPMAQFKKVNNPTTIRFTLARGEVRPHTLHVDITLAFQGARPVVTVNPGTPQQWTGPIPPATKSQQPDSRGVTRGTYRGNNMEFTFDIPASALVEGVNSIAIEAASGSAGEAFLSPSFVYDAVRLDR
jgi:rhamnogalacturonan endolyase